MIGEIIGGLLGLGGSQYNQRQNEKMQEESQDKNIKLQKEFAQYGLRWKVADAEAAGVHPVFAVGGGTAGAIPSSVMPAASDGSEWRQAGEMVSNAINARTVREREERAAELQAKIAASEIERNEAQAMLYRSEAARNLQAPPPFPELITDQNTWKATQNDMQQVFNPLSDAIVRRLRPEQLDTDVPIAGKLDKRGAVSNPSAPQPGWTVFEFGDGPVVLPYNEGNNLMESLEGLDVKYLPIVLAENRKRFGPEGTKRLLELYDSKFFQEDPDPIGIGKGMKWLNKKFRELKQSHRRNMKEQRKFAPPSVK